MPRSEDVNGFPSYTNAAGNLTLDEILWYASDTGGSETQAAQSFRNEDLDGDGYISWREFTGPKTGPKGVDLRTLKDKEEV